MELKFQLSNQIIFLNFNFKLQNSNFEFWVQIKIFKIKMLMFRLNNVFWTEILIFRFENNNLKFKYQILDQFFLNSNNNF